MIPEYQVAINVDVPESVRDQLNKFVGWLNRIHPKRNTRTGQRILWTQSTAISTILEDSGLWWEFVVEEGYNHE